MLKMKMHKQLAVLFFFVCTSLSVDANLIEIDILSERNHIRGHAGYDSPGYDYASYDITSSSAVSYEVDIDNFGNPQVSKAEAGDFGVYAFAGGDFGPSANAESTYLFSTNAWKISLKAFGVGENPFPFGETYSTITLTDKTTEHLLLDEIFGDTFDTYIIDESYLFNVNPTHLYELAIYANASSSEDGWSSRLEAEIIPAVPIPAAIWLFGTALVGLLGYGRRQQAA